MAKFKPFKVTSSQLKSLPIVEGQLIFVTDTSQTFLDIDGTTRTEFNGNQSSNTCFDMITNLNIKTIQDICKILKIFHRLTFFTRIV